MERPILSAAAPKGSFHSFGRAKRELLSCWKSEMLAKLEAPPKPDPVWSHSQGLSVSLGGLVGSAVPACCTIYNSSSSDFLNHSLFCTIDHQPPTPLRPFLCSSSEFLCNCSFFAFLLGFLLPLSHSHCRFRRSLKAWLATANSYRNPCILQGLPITTHSPSPFISLNDPR